MSSQDREKIYITGASGYVGRHLCQFLDHSRFEIHAIVRKFPKDRIPGVTYLELEDLKNLTISSKEKNHTFIHAAAQVHRKDVSASDYQNINVNLTETLGKLAVQNNFKNFYFFSSAAIYERDCQNDQRYKENYEAKPTGLYGESKWEAEKRLESIFKNTKIKFLFLRCPMIYGWNAPGNYSKLQRYILSSLPLPLIPKDNKKSFLSILNLVSSVRHLLIANLSYSGPLNLADYTVISTYDFIAQISLGLGKKDKVSSFFSKYAGNVLFYLNKAIYFNLYSNFQLDVSLLRSFVNLKQYGVRETIHVTQKLTFDSPQDRELFFSNET